MAAINSHGAGFGDAVSAISLAELEVLETREWMDSIEEVIKANGAGRCQELMAKVLSHAQACGVTIKESPSETSTDKEALYCNTIHPLEGPSYPGDLEIEQRITAITRWNALAMVVRANKESAELGGHLASYASCADLVEVGFNHFFRGDSDTSTSDRQADLVFFQPHAAPGIYARAFLEGRLTEEHLSNFRREVGGKGLPSYPHPWLMPDFWQFPTGSMGIGAITAIYQARFMRHMQDRGLMRPSERRVWAFLGDGEMDEPESIGGLTLAARENLDNLTFVINCNLQRLDGPVRGNSSIIRELERLFKGAGWNVLKVLWGSEWDRLFARDREHKILKALGEIVDGELQSYAANDGKFIRDRFFNKHGLGQLVSDLSDEQLGSLTWGGHDPVKIHAAFKAAVEHCGQPTVILALTKKGYGLGRTTEGRMSAHQQKKLDTDGLGSFRDRFNLPLSDDELDQLAFYRPPFHSAEIRYLHARRAALGGFLPRRAPKSAALKAPGRRAFGEFTFESIDREMSTTVAFVRMLASLLKNAEIGKRVVPIIADEARTFGMQSLFRNAGIYSHCGQLYEPEDQNDFLFYKESKEGQILEEGISEAGALASWISGGTSYSHHGIPMLPVFIFYSIFGFQRVGDLIWAAGDSRTRGFLVGATAGRTTLSGEGLQHQDGTSHLVATTVPNCRAYDPCFAYEVGVIVEHGLRTMLEEQEDVFYYITVMNENYVHPAMPEGAEEGILRGMYLLRSNCGEESSVVPNVQLLGSGTILREAIAAADFLERDWGIRSNVWSVTSFTELRRAGLEIERLNRIRATGQPRLSWVEQCLGPTRGPVIAASDYVRAVPDLIRTWVPRRYVALGTDGFGRSDRRAELRRFFEVDRWAIAFSAIMALVDEGALSRADGLEFMARYNYTPAERAPWADERDLWRRTGDEEFVALRRAVDE